MNNEPLSFSQNEKAIYNLAIPATQGVLVNQDYRNEKNNLLMYQDYLYQEMNNLIYRKKYLNLYFLLFQ